MGIKRLVLFSRGVVFFGMIVWEGLAFVVIGIGLGKINMVLSW